MFNAMFKCKSGLYTTTLIFLISVAVKCLTIAMVFVLVSNPGGVNARLNPAIGRYLSSHQSNRFVPAHKDILL